MEAITARLAEAGCVAAEDEAAEILESAPAGHVGELIERREKGEPLAWITGFVTFAGLRVRVEPGVYVPRNQTELLAARASALLPMRGLAADLCTGCGAVAAALRHARPQARVMATDVDPVACRCAAANGVEVYQGHLADPLPSALVGSFDVVTAVVPYVPTAMIGFLPRDVREWEPGLALDGGPDGTSVLEEAVRAAGRLLRPGGSVLLELGGDQPELIRPVLDACGFGPARRWADEEGDCRGLEASLQP